MFMILWLCLVNHERVDDPIRHQKQTQKNDKPVFAISLERNLESKLRKSATIPTTEIGRGLHLLNTDSDQSKEHFFRVFEKTD